MSTNSRLALMCLLLCLQLVMPLQVFSQDAPVTPTPDPNAGTAGTTPVPDATATTTATPTNPYLVIDHSTLTSSPDLHIGEGVTAVIDVGTLPNFNLTGDFTNHGTVYVISTNPDVQVANLGANNFLNNTGALLTTVLPQGGLYGYTNLVGGLSLTLTALNSFVNYGTISSAADLSIVAGGSITNASVAGALATIQAVNTVNLTSNIGNIVNSGLISSINNNINITSQIQNNLIINNIGGQLQALNGIINVGNINEVAKVNTTLWGGDVLSQILNLHSGDGGVTVNVNELSGVVNVNAGLAHITAASNNLQIGSMNLTGDPTFYNTMGDIVLNQDMNFAGQDIAIIAAGDVISNGAQIINTSSNNNGGSITIMAGALIRTSTTSPNALPPDGDSTNLIQVDGGLSTGGMIDFATTPIVGLSSVGGFNNGGNVTLVAYGGTRAGSGQVRLPENLTITTGSGGSDTNGNVTVFAGAQTGNGIYIGSINTSGANNGTGNIYLLTANPNLTGCTGCTGNLQIVNGRIISGAFNTDNKQYPVGGANIIAQDLTSSGGSIQLLAGGTITADNILTTGADANGFNGGVAMVAGASSGTVMNLTDVTTIGARDGASGNIFLVTSAPGPCTNCLLINRQANTGGSVVAEDLNASGNVDLRIGGDLKASSISAGGALNQDGGAVGIFVNNTNATGNTLELGGSGASSIGSITVASGTRSQGVIGIVSRGSGGINVAAQGSLILAPTANGNGGSIGLNAINGTLTSPGTWNFNAVGQGSGGSLNLAGKNVTITSPLNVTANGAGPANFANGGGVSISATQILTLPQGNTLISANGTGARGAGGAVNLASGSSTVLPGNVTLSAAGSGVGGGGRVTLGSNGLLNMGSGDIQIDVSAQNMIAGRADIYGATTSLGGNLIVNASSIGGGGGAISFRPGALTAGSGAINLNASSGAFSGGAITLNGTNMTFGSGAVTMNANGTSGRGGSISINANSITSGSGGMQANANGGIGGGIVDATINNFNGGSNLALSANGTGSSFGNGGTVRVVTTGGTNIGSQAGQVSVSASGYSTSGQAASGGIITIASSGNLAVDGQGVNAGTSAASGNGGVLTLQAGTAGQGILNITGQLNADGVGSGRGGTITLNYADSRPFNSVSTSGGSVTNVANISARALGTGTGGIISVNNSNNTFAVGVANNGTMDVSSAAGANGSINIMSSGSSISPNQDILVTGAGAFIGPVNAIGRNVTFDLTSNNALAVGQISSVGGNMTINAPTLSLNSNSILNSAGTLAINTNSMVNNSTIASVGNMTISSSSNLSLTGTGTLQTANVNISSSGGSVSAAQNTITGITTGSAATSYALTTTSGNLQVGNISAANGSTSLTANAGSLILTDGAQISANRGNVLLQNTSSTGTIVFRPFASVTAFSNTGVAGTGEVYVVIGSVPTSPTPGTAPADMTLNITNGGNIYFGADGISSQCCNHVANVNGSNVIFETGAAPATGIVLTTNNTINATNNQPTVAVAPLPPGHGGTPPGQGGTPPGLGGVTPPGQGGTPPGQGGVAPGQAKGNVIPPGQLPTTPTTTTTTTTTKPSGGNGNGKKVAYLDDDATTDGEYTAVSFIQGGGSLIGHAVGEQIETAITRTAIIKQSAASDVYLNHAGTLILKHGEIVVYSQKATEVRTGTCHLQIAAGSIIAISNDGAAIKVRDLYDAGRSSVSAVTHSNHNVKLTAGHELIVSSSGDARSHMAADKVGRRRVKETIIADDIQVATAEYSLLSLIRSSEVVGKLANSSDAQDKNLMDKVMKMSVALTTVTASHGPFARIAP